MPAWSNPRPRSWDDHDLHSSPGIHDSETWEIHYTDVGPLRWQQNQIGPRLTPATQDFLHDTWDEPLPMIMGTAFLLAPYAVGAGVFIFAPPPFKPVGLAMMVPGPSDPVMFALGYEFGEYLESQF